MPSSPRSPQPASLLCPSLHGGERGERHGPQRPSDTDGMEATKCHRYFLSQVMEVLGTKDQGQPSCLGQEGSIPHRQGDLPPSSFGIFFSNSFGSRHCSCLSLCFALGGSSLNEFFSHPLSRTIYNCSEITGMNSLLYDPR